MQFSPFSRHLIPLRFKYPPQHPVLKQTCSIQPKMYLKVLNLILLISDVVNYNAFNFITIYLILVL
jgi:hypothetical protein